MTKSTITRERLLEIIVTGPEASGAEQNELARIALAAMESEPVAEVYQAPNVGICAALGPSIRMLCPLEPGTKLYRHAHPAAEREQVRSAHAEWSQETFGNVGPVGPLKHLSKEALEAAEQPGDLSEWADMQFLLWDAQRRAGITDEQITQAMIEKLAVNKQREWPEPKDGEPRLHIKEQPAPVVNGEYGDAYQGAREDLAIWKRRALEAEESVRRLEQINDHLVKEAQGESRMGEPVIAQPAPVVQCPYPCGWDNLNKLAIQDAALVARGLVEGEPTTEAQRQAAISNNDRLLKVISACRAAMLQASPVCTCPIGDGSLRWPCPVHPGNSLAIGIDLASGQDRTVEVRYVAPPGYVMVPKEPTREILDEFDSIIDYGAEDSEDAWRRLLAAAPQPHNAPQNIPENIPGWIPVSERMPEESGRYWCYVEEQNSLGKSHYQWNCSWNGDVWSDKALTGRVTHWMPLPAAPQEVR